MTVQVYRKDLYAAKGLKPADTYDELVANAKALTDANARIYGLALRGFAGAGQNMYIYPSLLARLRRQLGAAAGNVVVNSPEAVQRPDLVRRHAHAVRAAGGAQLELARHRRRVLAGHGRDLHRRALVGRGHQQSRRSRRSSARSPTRAGPRARAASA